MMKSSFESASREQSEEKHPLEKGGVPYGKYPDGFYFIKDIGIGGKMPGTEDDFRDFIVNREGTGPKQDSTLVLPPKTVFESGAEGAVFFTLPKTRQRGRIFFHDGALYAEPVFEDEENDGV